MEPHIIRNRVPTPEEMADILGVSQERLARLRAIMDAPAPRTVSSDSRKSASGGKKANASQAHAIKGKKATKKGARGAKAAR